MTAPLVIGIDPSITATGVALSDGSLTTVGGKAERGDERLLDIAVLIGTACYQADLVVIEGFVSRSPAAAVLGLVHGVVRLKCLTAGVPYALIPPSTLKKYATGSGGASKSDMRMALYKRAGIDVRSDDETDAAWLRFAGLQHLGHPAVKLPEAQVRALGAASWPVWSREDQPRNPTADLWGKRNTPSGHFEALKRSGDVFKGVKREN